MLDMLRRLASMALHFYNLYCCLEVEHFNSTLMQKSLNLTSKFQMFFVGKLQTNGPRRPYPRGPALHYPSLEKEEEEEGNNSEQMSSQTMAQVFGK